MRRILVTLIASLCLGLGVATVPAGAAASSALFPAVKGGFGTKPTLTFPDSAAPSTLESKVLIQGKGPVVEKGDLLVANYFGQIWRGSVFSTSFGQGMTAFPIGVGQVIPGWDKTLVGAKIGSRMLLVVPPADGYGPSGYSAAGITGTSTLVFVVDLIHVYTHTAHAQTNAKVLATGAGGVTVHGALGKAPTITIAKGTPDPTKVAATVVAQGSGPTVKPGLVILQYVAVSWAGKAEGSTWQSGTPDGETVGSASNPSPLDVLVGLHLGSRVLVVLPETTSGGPYAFSIDLVAQPSSTPS